MVFSCCNLAATPDLSNIVVEIQLVYRCFNCRFAINAIVITEVPDANNIKIVDIEQYMI